MRAPLCTTVALLACILRPGLDGSRGVRLVPRAEAYGAGVFGYSGKTSGATCKQCHSGGTPPQSVTLSGPTTLSVGEQATYTLDIVTGASAAKVGFDIATTGGALAVISGQPNGSYLNMGEITHNKTWPSGATVQLRFLLTAPAQGGQLSLFVDALQSDGVDDEGGDDSLASSLDVTVAGGAPDLASVDLSGVDLSGVDLSGVDLASAPIDLTGGVDAVSAASQMETTPARDLGPPHDEPRWSCSCQLAPRASTNAAGPLALLVLLILALRRAPRSSTP